jgi:3-oxoacyl-[acyl-carrier-protein] synthase-3
LPSRILTNEDIAKNLDTSDEWIFTRTGIKERRIAEENEFSSDLAVSAARNLFTKNNIDPSLVDMIIVATTTADKVFPSTACLVQQKLGLKPLPAFDLQAVCSGFVYGLSIADALIRSGQYRNILFIGVDTMSKMVDWQDRGSCILFGDGAGALLVSASEQEGIIGSYLCSDGNLGDILYSSGGIGSLEKPVVMMNGKEVYKRAIEYMTQTIIELCSNSTYHLQDIDFLVPHQANSRIMEKVAENLSFPSEKVINIVRNYANNSAATIPLAIDYAKDKGLIKLGSLVATCAAGGGFTWGGNLIRF